MSEFQRTFKLWEKEPKSIQSASKLFRPGVNDPKDLPRKCFKVLHWVASLALYLQHSHEIKTKYIGFHFIYNTSVPRARMIAVVGITEATLKIPDWLIDWSDLMTARPVMTPKLRSVAYFSASSPTTYNNPLTYYPSQCLLNYCSAQCLLNQ